MKVTIDRFEGEYAIVELPDKGFVAMPKKLLLGARESDVIDIALDEKETKARKRQIGQMMERLFIE